MSDFSKDELLAVVRELVPGFSSDGTVKRLSGGNINHVWRIGGKPHTLIAKHAPPHIASNSQVPLSDARIGFEALALSLFTEDELLRNIAGNEIRPPKPIAFDPDRSFLIMEDVGEFNELSQAEIGTIPAEKTGERLGRFIGELHSSTFRDDELRNSFHNLEIQSVRNQLQYRPAHKYANLQDESLDNEIKTKSTDLGNRLMKPGKCLIMGDLWPPSFCVNQAGEIRLIDWEFVHFGRPLQDLGHFAAHCWMQQHVAGDSDVSDSWRKIWRSFWSGYKSGAGTEFEQIFDGKELADIGVHIGTEILMRTFGPFKDGYIYESYDDTHSVLNEAKELAIEYIMDPKKSTEDFGLDTL